MQLLLKLFKSLDIRIACFSMVVVFLPSSDLAGRTTDPEGLILRIRISMALDLSAPTYTIKTFQHRWSGPESSRAVVHGNVFRHSQ